MKMSPMEFCVIWNSAKSVPDVVEKTGMPYHIVTSRSTYYRKIGVALKRFKSCKKEKIDVGNINKILLVR